MDIPSQNHILGMTVAGLSINHMQKNNYRIKLILILDRPMFYFYLIGITNKKFGIEPDGSLHPCIPRGQSC